MKPLGILWQTVITGNRLFGALCLIGGVEAAYEAFRRGAFDARFWEWLGIGMLYMKAPLFRSRQPLRDDKPD